MTNCEHSGFNIKKHHFIDQDKCLLNAQNVSVLHRTVQGQALKGVWAVQKIFAVVLLFLVVIPQ